MRNISCNLCSNSDEKLLFESKDILYHVTDKIYRVVQCTHCGLVYLNPQPEMPEIASFYPDAYRPYRQKKEKSSYTFPAYTQKKVLDIGCGSGDLLIGIAKKHPDWALHGIDFDARAVEAARSFGFQIFHGSLHEASFENNFFDEIYMNHVLEHIQNPLEILTESAHILKKGGKLFITIPNFRSLSRIVFSNKWYHIDSPRHLYHFTPVTLSAMLTKAGYGKIKIHFIPSPKYFLQSFALWKYGKKKSYPKLLWRALVIPARFIALIKLSSTMQVYAKKN